MDLREIAKALRTAKKFELDALDLCILAAVVEQKETTIMRFLSGFFLASPSTVHARVKRMVAGGFLVKSVNKANERFRPITKGPKLKKFLDELNVANK